MGYIRKCAGDLSFMRWKRNCLEMTEMTEMTGYVLMNKRTGHLMLGYRINFLDKGDFEPALTEVPYRIGILTHDGWVMAGPEPINRCFFNNECEEWFENLGEL